jgi:peptidoglycan/LPS O-acetylase OafA/YrhL
MEKGISTESKNNESMEKKRLYYLDWLRMFAIFMVFVYHTIRIFGQNNEIVNDPNYVQSAEVFEWLILPFGMPLFFIISGMSVFYGVQYMKKKQIPKSMFIKERALRLILPYLVGTLTYMSMLSALLNTIEGSYTLKYSIYDPRNFIDFYFTSYFRAQNLEYIFSGWHLWFLVILFAFNLILYKYFMSKAYTSTANETIKKREGIKAGRLFLLIIPLYLIEIINPFGITGLPRAGGYDAVSFFIFFYLGFKFASQGNFQEKLKRNIKPALIIGITTLIIRGVEVFLVLEGILVYYPFFHGGNVLPSPYFFLYWALFVVNGWSMMIVILYYFSKFLNKDHKYRKKLNEIVMPFYILHYIVLNLVGTYALVFFESYPMIDFIRIISILGLSFLIIIGLSLLIAKLNILRLIFGMRKKT